MKISKKLFALIILFSAILVFSIFPVSAAAITVPQVYTIADEGVDIEVKYKKAAMNKITFNANGGKIGSKKTIAMNIKKGSKIKKFPVTPKRAGYVFKGWYSKKSGGKKINTNVKLTKSVIVYAQWMKKSNSNDNSLIGGWSRSDMFYDSFRGTTSPRYFYYNFKKDGTFTFFEGSSVAMDYTAEQVTGKFTSSNGKLFLKELTYKYSSTSKKWSNMVVEYSFYKENGRTILLIPRLYEKTYIDISQGESFKK